MNLSTAASSSRLLLVNSWLSSGAPAGVDDRHQVVGAEVALDELPRRALHALRAAEPRCADRRGPSRRRGRRTGARCVLTSGSIGVAANSGRSARSTGMSTSVKVVIVCGLPSSKTWKSSFFRSRTNCPCWSVTTRRPRRTRPATLKVGVCGACGGGAGGWPAASTAPDANTISAVILYMSHTYREHSDVRVTSRPSQTSAVQRLASRVRRL